MCDADKLQAMSSTLSLLPGNIIPHLALGVASASFVGYAMHYNCPSAKLGRVNTALTNAEKTLAEAKARCIRDYLALVKTEARFLRAKLTVSKLQTSLVEARDLPGWKNYLKNLVTISRCLVVLQREIRDLQKSLLVLVEAANRRQLTKDLNETQAVLHGTMYHRAASGHDV